MKISINKCIFLCFIVSLLASSEGNPSTNNFSFLQNRNQNDPFVRQIGNRPIKPTGDNCTWIKPLNGVRRDVTIPNAPHVVFFTDGTNFDDVVTLLYILKSHVVKLVAIYIQSNGWANGGPSHTNMRNMLYMISDAGISIPVILGSYSAINDEMAVAGTLQAPQISYRFSVPVGRSGLLFAETMLGLAGTLPRSPLLYDPYTDADTDDSSIPNLFDLLESIPESTKIRFLSTGTLTPIAKMFSETHKSRITKILSRIEGLYIMGGSVNARGNVFTVPGNKHAEFNIYCDPHAAQYAFKNMTNAKVKVVLVPLDATDRVPITEEMLNTFLLHPKTPEAQLVGRLMARQRATWFDPPNFFSTAFLWDVSAAISMNHPELVLKKAITSLRVIIENGPFGEDFAWTKNCSSNQDEKSEDCSEIIVYYELNATAVQQDLIGTLQNTTNSAQRAPNCPIQ